MKEKKKTNKELEKEIEEYTKPSFLDKIPFSVKAIFFKYWLFGAICFFVLMGLGAAGVYGIVATLICGLIGGALFDMLYGHVLELIEPRTGDSKYFVIFRSKKVVSTIVSILYITLVFYLGSIIISAIVSLYEDNSFWLFQEPLTQALVLFAIDGLFMIIKFFILFIKDKVEDKKLEKRN